MRDALLAAAAEVFTMRGFTATTTREVARAAGVSESVLYRHFPTKGGLFAASVLAPFLQFLAAFSEVSARYVAQPLDVTDMMRLFVSELVGQLTVHRGAVRTFLAASDEFDEGTRTAVYGAFDEVMADLGVVVDGEVRRRGRIQRGRGPELMARSTVGMVLSLVVFDDLLLPTGDRRPSRDELVEHLVDILLHGT